MDGVASLALTVTNSHAADVYVKYIEMLVGRDKACRLGQYAARLLVYLIGRRMALQGKTAVRIEWLATVTKVQQTLGTTRKVMRVGKFASFARLAVRALAGTQGDEIVRVLDAVHKLGMTTFMAADSLGLAATTLGLVRLRDPQGVARIGQRAWMYALLAQAVSALYKLRNLALRDADLRRVRFHVDKAADAMGGRECAVEEQAIRTQRTALARQLATSVLDLAIPVKGLGILPLNEGLVALAGTVTSLMGIQDALSKAAAN